MAGISQYFLIGIDDYNHSRYPRLNNAKGDAERLKKVLSERYGFVEALPPLFNADAARSAIEDTLNSLYSAVNEEDSLVVYFAGHGEMSQVNNKGYWVPIDGTEQQSSLIRNSTILDLIENIKCKHILLISDSCFSGSLLNLSRAAEITDHDELESRPSRWIITSGGLHTVTDGVTGRGSPFSRSLCEVLETNRLPSVSINELFEEVFRLTEPRRQIPLKGFMAIDDHKGGQMIFRLSQMLTSGDDPQLFEKPEFPMPAIAAPDFHIARSLTFHEGQNTPEAWFYEPLVGRVYLDEVVQTTHRVVILGGAGSGKSNELRALASKLQEGTTNSVPILKKFNTYTDEDIEDYLPSGWDQVYLPALVLLLDGLDEVQPQYFSTAVRKLAAFSDRFPQVRIIVTCRTNFYELPDKEFGGTLNGFSVYVLNDLNLADVQHYANMVLDQEGSNFMKQIDQPGLMELVQKPFFLQVLINYFGTNQLTGGNRSAIIHDALNEYLLNNKRHYHITGVNISPHLILQSLERIAFVMELTGKNFIKDADLYSIFKDSAEYNNCKYLPAFRYEEERAQWMFDHNNIQEYLASRVLSRQPFETLINILSVSSAGEKKVKSTWVNTLSFLINTEESDTVDVLLEWIIEHDREIIIRFEPDRVTAEKRTMLFKQIFEFYSVRQIWLHSNKFSHKELARFGQSEDNLNFLLEQLKEGSSTRMDRINALHVLFYFELSYFPSVIDEVRNLLIALLDDTEFQTNDIYTVIGVLAELGYADRYLVDLILERYGSRKNQYLRASIYKLLISSELVNDYVQVLLDGMEYASFGFKDIDRDSVSLMDETFLLRIALEKVSRADALKKLFTRITHGVSRLSFTSDYTEIVEGTLKRLFQAHVIDHDLFDNIALFFIKEAGDHMKRHVPQLLNFFAENDLRIAALKFALFDDRVNDYERYEAMTLLIDNDTIPWLVQSFNEKLIPEKLIESIYQNFVWRRRNATDYLNILQAIEKGFNENTELLLVRPEVKDWVTINSEKTQKSFDLLFHPEELKAEIERLLKFIDADPIGIDDLYPTKNFLGDEIDDAFASSVIGLIRNFTYRGSQITQQALRNWLTAGENLLEYRVQEIHDAVMNQPELVISAEQISFIREWVENKGNNRTILWHFIQRFEITLPEEKLLSFTLYFDSSAESEITKSGTIEILEAFLSRKKLKDRVAQNLSNGINNILVWTSNAGYALRHRVTTAYEPILQYLEAAHDQEYRFDDLLKLWFSQVNDANRLKKFISTTVSADLRSLGLKLLINSGKEKPFLIGHLKDILKSGERQDFEKLEAANYLVELNDVDGFNYLVAYVLTDPDPNFEFRRYLASFKYLTGTAVIPQLLDLLTLGKRDNFKLDVFNDLESIVLEAFNNIAVQSDENFSMVKKNLERYISEKQGLVKNVNFLHYTIEKIQEQFNLKKTANFTTADAVALFESL